MGASIWTKFNQTLPFSCAQGRYGEMIFVQGHGVQSVRYQGFDPQDASAQAHEAGMDAPTLAPEITLAVTPVKYYVARVDVTKPGACYWSPPTVTFATSGAAPARATKALSYLNQSSVGEIVVSDGGKGYLVPPTVSLGNSHGSGAVVVANLDGTPPNPTGLHHWEIVEGPPFPDETELQAEDRSQFAAWRPVTINIPGTGSFTDASFPTATWDCTPPGVVFVGPMTLNYTVTGAGSGTGCKIRIGFYGATFWTRTTSPCSGGYCLAWGVSGVTIVAPGSGYSESSIVRVVIESSSFASSGKRLVLEGCTPGNARNTTTPRFKISSLSVTNQGSNYNVAPELKITSTSGFGAYAEASVAGGKIVGAALESGGGGYRTVPTVEVVSGGAEAFAVARPHLRGKYQCYYRYVDETPASKGGPIPGVLSPVKEIDCGNGTDHINWTCASGDRPARDSRKHNIEMWRTTSNQSTTLYRVALPALAAANFKDDLTDEELRNPDRTGYAAMPIVLPNGELNANRFVRPPNDKTVVVRFQDRMWYGVDTSGSEPNSIYFSEIDEPESVPDVNELVLQQNARDGDCIKALIPFGSTLLIMQTRRCYSLTYARKPLIDGSVTPLAYRGCMSQRCWDLHGGLCYAMDRHGIYSITPEGRLEELSGPIDDVFRTQINPLSTTWNFLVVDPKTRILRAFVCLNGENSTQPTAALCYSIDAKTWWTERYPQRITAGAVVQMFDMEHRVVYCAKPPNKAVVIDEGSYDLALGTIVSASVTNRGAGYRTPPEVTAPTVPGAKLQAVLDGRGGIGGIWILNGGHGWEPPAALTVTIGGPNDPTCTAPVQATATISVGSGPAYVPYRYKTGNLEYVTDGQKGGDADASRAISVTYRPQPSVCELIVRTYYNNSTHPRPNAVPRDRGAGFRSTVPDGAHRLDMGQLTKSTGSDTGVARAVLSGKTFEDQRSGDKHVSVEMLGARRTAAPVILYQLEVGGVTGEK
jgi:hypothetical protein